MQMYDVLHAKHRSLLFAVSDQWLILNKILESLGWPALQSMALKRHHLHFFVLNMENAIHYPDQLHN